MSKLYNNRELEAMEPHFTRHLSAMTGEGLHNKVDIAAELAFRDAEIDWLRTKLANAKTAPVGWRYTGNETPECGIPCIGQNDAWIDPDFNEHGVRECFTYGDGTEWHTAKWADGHDCFETTDADVPTKWRYMVEVGE